MVVKVSKPKQDMRFDVPVVGLPTVEVMKRCKATALAIDAHRTLLFDRTELIAAADAAGITIRAFEPIGGADNLRRSRKKIMPDAKRIRVAVVGAGEFGRNHARVYSELPGAELVGIVDTNADRAKQVATEFNTQVLPSIESLTGKVDAASVAVPTAQHAKVGCALLRQGIDVLVEKPMATSIGEADELISAAAESKRILQIGHLERFNPAVVAAREIMRRPLFFEVHRLGIYTPRSLDIDVVFDVMIHDLDILLALVGEEVTDVKAVGIPVVSDKVDIAHARLEFASRGCECYRPVAFLQSALEKCAFFRSTNTFRWTTRGRMRFVCA